MLYTCIIIFDDLHNIRIGYKKVRTDSRHNMKHSSPDYCGFHSMFILFIDYCSRKRADCVHGTLLKIKYLIMHQHVILINYNKSILTIQDSILRMNESCVDLLWKKWIFPSSLIIKCILNNNGGFTAFAIKWTFILYLYFVQFYKIMTGIITISRNNAEDNKPGRWRVPGNAVSNYLGAI